MKFLYKCLIKDLQEVHTGQEATIDSRFQVWLEGQEVLLLS
ncbi:hypothetical protein [Streptococcus oricebi]